MDKYVSEPSNTPLVGVPTLLPSLGDELIINEAVLCSVKKCKLNQTLSYINFIERKNSR
jgi:hypothetical protein